MLDSGASGRAIVPVGCLDGHLRGGRAARRWRPLPGQGRPHRRGERQRRDRRLPRGLRRPGPARRRPGHDRRRRDAQQGPPRGQRHPGRVAGHGPGGGRRARPAALPLRGRRRRPCAAGAHDERGQRRRPRRQLHRPPGVHDHAGRGGLVRRGPALGRRDLPRPGRRAARARPVHGRGRRGRLRPEPAAQRGRRAHPGRGHRGGGPGARRRDRHRHGPGQQRVLPRRCLRTGRRGPDPVVGRDGRLLRRPGRPVPDRLPRGRDGRGRLGRLGRRSPPSSARRCSWSATTCS